MAPGIPCDDLDILYPSAPCALLLLLYACLKSQPAALSPLLLCRIYVTHCVCCTLACSSQVYTFPDYVLFKKGRHRDAYTDTLLAPPLCRNASPAMRQGGVGCRGCRRALSEERTCPMRPVACPKPAALPEPVAAAAWAVGP